MTTMRDAVNDVLSRLNGGQVGLLGQLSVDLTINDDMFEVVNAVPNVTPGTIVSIDLETLYITRVVDAGKRFEFMRLHSSGMDVLAPAIVRFAPAQTSVEVFDRLSAEIKGMSSPANGLYRVMQVNSPVNYSDGTYYLPDSSTATPIRVLGVKALMPGQDVWVDMNGWVWQAERGVVQFYGCPPGATQVQVLYAMPFTTPTDLADDLDDLGIYHTMHDIPVLGACAYLSIGLEGRRIIPTSQGDPRRAAEIPMTAGTSLAREYKRMRDDRVQEEATRLVTLYPWRRQDLSSV